MAYTLDEAAKLSNDVLQAGVIELFVKDDPILERLPFVTIVGNGLTYNTELTEATAQFYAVGDDWVESTPTVEQATAVLRILGGDADVDNFLKATRSNINDLKAEAIAAKVKAIKKAFMTQFYYGYSGVDAKAFSGLHYLISSSTYNTQAMGTAVNACEALSMTKLEATIDMIKGFTPDIMMMSKQMRRNINTYLHTAGGITYEDRANRRVQTVFGIPVGVSDYISDAENCNELYGATYGQDHDEGISWTAPTDADEAATTIFILSFDPKGCCGLQSGAMTTVPIGDLEIKDASRFRIKWYVSMMLQNLLSCSKICGIENKSAAA